MGIAKVGLYGLEDKPFAEDSLETAAPSGRGYDGWRMAAG